MEWVNSQTRFAAFSSDQKRLAHLKLCEHALTKWQEYASSMWCITYADSVVGTKQTVDKSLPMDAFQSACAGRDMADVNRRYDEPITALQDSDLTFPETVTYAYYSIYNAFRKYAMKESIDDWVIVNQALSSETEPSRWEALLRAALERSM
jgi:hypothetical protein